jgi:glycerol uptake facilitator-like aquaporin
LVHFLDLFANPAVTLARGFTTTFAGIAVNHVPAFIVAQLIGAFVAALLSIVLFPSVKQRRANDVGARQELITPGE